MVPLNEVLQVINSHTAAGAAGGMVRGMTARESFGRVFMYALVGAASAHYMTPILLWVISHVFNVPESEIVEFQVSIKMVVGFFMGMAGLSLSGFVERFFMSLTMIIEKIIMKFFKL